MLTNKTAWMVAGGALTLGVLYWLAHSWNVTGVVEAGEPTVTYRNGDGGNTVPTGSAQKVP